MFLDKKIKTLIGSERINKLYLIIFFTIFIALIETSGIGMVIPLVQIILNPDYIDKIKDYIPIFQNYSNSKLIFIFLLTLWLIFIIKNVLYLSYIYVSNKFNQNIRENLANKLYYNFLNQKYNFHLKNSSVELVKNINIDLEDFRFGMFHFFVGIAEVFITLFLVILLLFYDFYSTLIILAIFSVIILIYFFIIKKKSKKIGEQIFDTMTFLQRNVKETLTNIKLIKIFSSKNFFENEFKLLNKNYVNSRLLVDVIVNAPKALIESIVITLIVVYLLFFYNESNTSNLFSSIGLYGLVFFRLMPALNRMVTAYSYRNILMHTINKLYDIYEASKVENKKNTENKIDQLRIENIKLENVSFSYGDKKILGNVNMSINKNQFVGIIGESGAGKSTFLNLILGLLKPDVGNIIYNNKVNIYNNIDSFNKKISYVPQGITILERSIKENIAFGEKVENIDLEKIKLIIKKTKLDTLIEKMKYGLDSIINTDNLNISGGELQRIGLARALYFDSDLLILDEATNSLDIKTENEILKMIHDNFLGKKMIIFITHKVKNLEKSDFTIEIKDKKIKKIEND